MSVVVAGGRFGFYVQAPVGGFPEAWRELDRTVWRWAGAHGGSELLALAAGWCSYADGQGHSALPLTAGGELPGWSEEEKAELAASPLVASAAIAAAQSHPFVLDHDHFYLLRNYRAEDAVAVALARRRNAAVEPLVPITDQELRSLFKGSWSTEEERQRAAVRQALGRRLMVLTGGPGTGKTTTVLRMLLGLSREHLAKHNALPEVHITAPTGKAAQRLSESLRQGAERLRAGGQPLAEAWVPHLAGVLSAESGTVHRLLGSRGRHGGFAFHAGEPLPADILVVDEASMLDLGLLRAVLAALREEAVLILVGDADQLTSVGTGAVMLDVVQALESDARGDLVRLDHCFRADQSLVPINLAVRAGDPEAFDQAITQASQHSTVDGNPAARTLEVVDESALRRRLNAWARDMASTLDQAGITAPFGEGDILALTRRLSTLRRRQLLCALRQGPFGSEQAAAYIANCLRRWVGHGAWAGQVWYPGRSVMVVRNDAASRLYNGDVGICVLVEQDSKEPLLRVAFEASTEDSERGQPARLFDPSTLAPHEDASAITIHKSQGSEYADVAVLLPPDPESLLLSRQTLYTGLSRAQKRLELWSTTASTLKTLATPLQRHGRLAKRIQESG